MASPAGSTSSNTSTTSAATPWRCEQRRIHRDSNECTDSPPTSPIVNTLAKRARFELRTNSQSQQSVVAQGTPISKPRPQQSGSQFRADRQETMTNARGKQRRTEDGGGLRLSVPISPGIRPSPPLTSAISPLHLFDDSRPPFDFKYANGTNLPDMQTPNPQPDNDIRGNPFRFSRRLSQASLVPETPLLAQPLQCRQSPKHHSFSSATRNPFSASRTGDLSLPSRSRSQDPTNTSAAEIARLRATQTALISEFTDSTALIYRLQTRNTIQEANDLVYKSLLTTAEGGIEAANEQVESERVEKKAWMGICIVLLLGFMLYAYWRWWNGAEMEFVRMRRRHRFGI